MFKRALAVIAASLLPLTVVAAPSAQAASSCNISVPSKVAISSHYREIKGTFSAGCRYGAEYAFWSVIHPTQGAMDGFWFDPGMTSETLDWYDWNPKGVYTVRGDGAYDLDYDPMAQNSPKMTVKLGSRLYVGTSRSGSVVTISGSASRYSTYYGTFRPWSGKSVTLQSKSCSSCSWKYVTSASTNRYGKVTIKRSASTARYWRLRTTDDSTTFGHTSATSKR